jgi:hypothetical protein
VRHAGNGLAERRHLFGLQQLLVKVARPVVHALALADVANERLYADSSLYRRLGPRSDLDPHRGVVQAPHTKKVVVHRALGCQALEEGGSGKGVGEALGRERRNVSVGRIGSVAKDRL